MQDLGSRGPVIDSEAKAEAEIDEGAHVAALDLGSNSFHLVICREAPSGLIVVDRRREQVQLRAGLDEEGMLSEAAMERAHDAIRRFAQLLRPRPGLRVRVAATNTFRSARNADAFRARLEETLGHPITIIGGEEEARLIFLGVTHSMPTGDRPAIVFDIGGGSTECILGREGELSDWRSYEMGCVSWTNRFFPDGRFDRTQWDAARAAAHAVLGPLGREWEERSEGGAFIGSSGTIRAAERILRTLGVTTHGITRAGIQKVVKTVKKKGCCTSEELPGLKRSRAPVFLGGLVILESLFEAFHIERMEVSHGAMREGIVHDMMGWAASTDRRPRTLDALARRYRVDEDQAGRVAKLAKVLHAGVAKAWGIDDEDAAHAVQAAARLHEIGLQLSHRHHHLHAAYLIANGRMPGYSPRDRAVLAAMVGAQRGRLDQAPFRRMEGLTAGTGSVFFTSLAPFVGGLMDLDSDEQRRALRLAIILRFAALLSRDRSEHPPEPVGFTADGGDLHLSVPADWLAERALTARELQGEVEHLETVGVRLVIGEG